jgi:biotin synthase
MGAAWRDLAGRKRGFERILEMVREVRGMGMEVCTTLGMLSPEQARQLKEAYVPMSTGASMQMAELSFAVD